MEVQVRTARPERDITAMMYHSVGQKNRAGRCETQYLDDVWVPFSETWA